MTDLEFNASSFWLRRVSYASVFIMNLSQIKKIQCYTAYIGTPNMRKITYIGDVSYKVNEVK